MATVGGLQVLHVKVFITPVSLALSMPGQQWGGLQGRAECSWTLSPCSQHIAGKETGTHPSLPICAWMHCVRLCTPGHEMRSGRDADNNDGLSAPGPERWHSLPIWRCSGSSHSPRPPQRPHMLSTCLSSQARELLCGYGLFQGHKERRGEQPEGLLGPWSDYPRSNYKIEHPFMHKYIHQKKHEMVLVV